MQTQRYTYTRAPGETLHQFARRMLALGQTTFAQSPIVAISYLVDGDRCHVDVTRVAPERPRRRSCRGGRASRPSRRGAPCHG